MRKGREKKGGERREERREGKREREKEREKEREREGRGRGRGRRKKWEEKETFFGEVFTNVFFALRNIIKFDFKQLHTFFFRELRKLFLLWPKVSHCFERRNDGRDRKRRERRGEKKTRHSPAGGNESKQKQKHQMDPKRTSSGLFFLILGIVSCKTRKKVFF